MFKNFSIFFTKQNNLNKIKFKSFSSFQNDKNILIYSNLKKFNLYLKRNKTQKKKIDTIKIWENMNLEEFSKAINISVEDILKNINLYKMKNFNRIESLKYITTSLKKNYEIIEVNQNDKYNDQNSVKSLIEENQVPIGKKIINKIPVATIMGHVDHGKTTILDALRDSEIAKNEFGGITQHIGAFVVSLSVQNKKKDIKSLIMLEDTKNLITFLDTPGHAAFFNMRERGAMITDFVILVVAVEDGIMPQTLECINFTKKHKVPVIVAVNKIDKLKNLNENQKEKKIFKIKNDLIEHGLDLEFNGGDVQLVELSALEKIGLDNLKEAIIAQSETLELKCIVDGGVRGIIIESLLDKSRGRLTTILVQSGSLKKGDFLITENGLAYAKVRSIFDENSQVIDNVKPGFPIQIIGWKPNDNYFPRAGDKIIQMPNEKVATKIFNVALKKFKSEKSKKFFEGSQLKAEEHRLAYQAWLEKKYNEKIKKRMPYERKKFIKFDEQEESKKLNLIIKADVYGTLETLLDLFENYPENENLKINLLSYGIGSISENDVNLASSFYKTIIYSFNVDLNDVQTKKNLEENKIIYRKFNVIYHLVEDLKSEINSRLPKVNKHDTVGEGVISKLFYVYEKKEKICIAGVECTKGFFKNDNKLNYKLIRNNEEITNDLKIVSLKRFKEDVQQVKEKNECGIIFNDKNLVLKPGDLIVCYKTSLVNQKINWQPRGFF